jgi:protein-S-isoprenylcysteine O-methyltransferase Ste14
MSTSVAPPARRRPEVAAGVSARFAQIGVGFVIEAAILFLAAGRITWLWAWVYLGISLASVLIIGPRLLRTSPEMVAERGRHLFRDMQTWDKFVSSLWAVAFYLALPLVAGLDERFGWTAAFSAWWNIAGGIGLALGLALVGWAMLSNAYFSTVVRIQSERGQTVCRSGPYRYVRHPGYVGMVLESLAVPLLLGSGWAFIPGIAAAVLMVTRTWFEDRFLHANLPGYVEYARGVRHRLMPGIW